MRADYNARLPHDFSRLKVFVATWAGLTVAISFGAILGATLLTISDPAYTGAFEDGGIGGLLNQVLSPWNGFGKFLVVLLALSTVRDRVCCRR